MQRDDYELIRSILSGDKIAFSELVEKYQKGVHALAWRETGDFQVAEEIAQDTFLQAYKKLATLKNTHQFAGWLYVIARNRCTDWHRRKKPTMQSLEATNSNTLDETAYERFIEEQREKAAAERRRELVKNLLEKLPESERTVMTLYYLGEMTSEAISKFLGVSVNTIKSRLRRARMRLKEEEPMIRDTLGSVQLSNNFTQNIMEQITHIKPTPITNGKPFLPWTALGSTAVLILLLMGASNQFLTHFQKPYSLEAQSETSIELLNVPVVLDIQSQTDSQRRIGSNVFDNKNGGVGQQESDTVLSSESNVETSNISVLTDQWTQAIGPETGNVQEIFLTSQGELITVSPTGIYRMTDDATGWVLINNEVPTEYYSDMPMAEYKGILYVVSSNEIFASADGGVTWKSIGLRPRGSVIELIITDEVLYLVMDDKILRSTDGGKQWIPFNVGIKDREIFAATAIEDNILIGTDRGIYRLNSDEWEQLSVGTFRSVNSITVSDNTLYVSTSPNDADLTATEMKTKLIREIMRNEKSNRWEVFRSDDFGDTWIKITPSKRSFIDYFPIGGKIIAIDNTILVIGMINIYRSNDKGETWTNLGIDADSLSPHNSSIIAVDENTFYKESLYKLLRSTDGGKSWQPFMKGIIASKIKDVVVYNDRIYAHAGTEIVQSSDGGNTWTSIKMESGTLDYLAYPNMTVTDNIFYAVARDEDGRTRICSLGSNGDQLVPMTEIPAVSGNVENNDFNLIDDGEGDNLRNVGEETLQVENRIKNIKLLFNLVDVGAIAVTDHTIYIDRNQRLFKWKKGYPEWLDLGLDTGEDTQHRGFSLAASDKTVYVGKQDGHLFQSLDAGNNWEDITSSLPLMFEQFYEIVFVGSTVYVATNNGVLVSESGITWRVLTDNTDTNIEIVSLAIDDSTVFGASHTEIYELDDEGEWWIISPEVPDQVEKLIIHKEKLYIITKKRGMYYIPIN